jgi:hypothetical protein
MAIRTRLKKEWSFRSGAVRSKDVGYVLGANDGVDEDEYGHTAMFVYNRDGEWGQEDLEWISASCCVCRTPKEQMVAVGDAGQFVVEGSGDFFEGNIDDSVKREKESVLRSVRDIDGKAYAVGMMKQVYRRDGPKKWTDLGASLSDKGGFEAIHGFSEKDLYAVGWKGEIWHFDGKKWDDVDSPTNKILTGVCCAGDGYVYVCGKDGVLIRGKGSRWDMIDHDETEEDFWDLEWFKGELYLSTLSFVYNLKGASLKINDMDENPASSCYHLSSAKDQILWSVGEKDVMTFDGKKWKQIE